MLRSALVTDLDAMREMRGGETVPSGDLALRGLRRSGKKPPQTVAEMAAFNGQVGTERFGERSRYSDSADSTQMLPYQFLNLTLFLNNVLTFP